MGMGLLMVRAELTDPGDRPAFDRWYGSEHLPDAFKITAPVSPPVLASWIVHACALRRVVIRGVAVEEAVGDDLVDDLPLEVRRGRDTWPEQQKQSGTDGRQAIDHGQSHAAESATGVDGNVAVVPDGPSRTTATEDEIAGSNVVEANRHANGDLVECRPGKTHSDLCIRPLHEARAVEAGAG